MQNLSRTIILSEFHKLQNVIKIHHSAFCRITCKLQNVFKMINSDEILQIFHYSADILQFASDSSFCRMMNSDDILQLAKSTENFSFLINSESCKINVESYILIIF